jgi:hypothetical protein
VLLGHVRYALWVQVLDMSFHSSAKGMLPILYAVLFQQPQHTIDIGRTSYIHSIFRQFIHGSKLACEPVSIGEIETVAPCLEKGLTQF